MGASPAKPPGRRETGIRCRCGRRLPRRRNRGSVADVLGLSGGIPRLYQSRRRRAKGGGVDQGPSASASADYLRESLPHVLECAKQTAALARGYHLGKRLRFAVAAGPCAQRGRNRRRQTFSLVLVAARILLSGDGVWRKDADLRAALRCAPAAAIRASSVAFPMLLHLDRRRIGGDGRHAPGATRGAERFKLLAQSLARVAGGRRLRLGDVRRGRLVRRMAKIG